MKRRELLISILYILLLSLGAVHRTNAQDKIVVGYEHFTGKNLRHSVA